jgi:hypothetical protein
MSQAGNTCTCRCGTSNPATITPTRGGFQISRTADPTACAIVVRWASRPASASTHWSTSARGTTSVCPGLSGLMERKATATSSDQTNRPGSSPSMIFVNTVLIDRAD